jgi:hypothetical protein
MLQISDIVLVFRPSISQDKSETLFDGAACLALLEMKKCDDTKDLIIVVEKKSFRCHKSLVMVRSKFLKAMCTSDFKEKGSDSVEIRDFPSELFEKILNFMYGYHLELDHNNVLEIYQAADRFIMPDLRRICTEKLYLLLDTNNIFDLVNLFVDGIDNRENFECFDVCARFILDNYESIKDNRDFIDILKKKHEYIDLLVLEITKKKKTNVLTSGAIK